IDTSRRNCSQIAKYRAKIESVTLQPCGIYAVFVPSFAPAHRQLCAAVPKSERRGLLSESSPADSSTTCESIIAELHS
ncbi:hypothetical protein LCGC14_1036480, partial [marine sediment metagenome]